MRRRLLAAVVALAATMAPATDAGASHDLTELLSTGPAGGNAAAVAAYAGASDDGNRVWFQTLEPLVSADTDTRTDIYERSPAGTALISTGPSGGNGGHNASFAGASADGERVFFHTTERLLAADTDTQTDLYERSGATTTLVSTGPAGGNGAQGAFFDDVSTDGTRVFFHTSERLVAGDTDAEEDVYQRTAGSTTLVSTGPAGGNGAFPAFLGGISDDGTVAFLETSEALTADDTDARQDVYGRSGTTTQRHSMWNASHPGNGAFDAYYDANSADGQAVLYSTDEALATNDCDTDAQFDVYQRNTAGGSALRSFDTACTGGGAFDAEFVGASPNLSRVWFETEEHINGQDSDSSRDVWESGPATRLVSRGPAGGNGAFDATWAGAAIAGSLVYFETEESLVAADTDANVDVYAFDNDAGFQVEPTQLISAGAAGGNGALDARFEGSSDDGLRTFFSTDEVLAAGDTDLNTDVYERQPPVTSLLSTGPAGGNGALDAQYAGASRDGVNVLFTTVESLVAADTDSSSDVYARRDTAGYARPKGATPVRVSLVPSFTPCTSPNRTHGPPLAFGSCAAPAQQSGQLTVGTPDANGAAAESIGFVRIDAIVASSEDPADVRVAVSLTDVRRRSDNSDYTGEIGVVSVLRITDRGSGPSGSEPATMIDSGQRLLSVACGATPGPAGASCGGFTTLNAIVPGSVVEGRRAIWQLDDVIVTDGGADEDVDTAPNSTFARQGVFVP